MRPLFSLALTIFIISFLSGCASPARIEQMTISSQEAAKYKKNTPLKNKLTVSKVDGGEETNPLWTSEIDSKSFQQALEKSLQAAKLLSASKNSRYSLSAQMVSVDQPMFGLDMTVTSTIKYTLTDNKTKKVIFTKKIASKFTATMSDAFFGPERLKLANEGSAKGNISKIIRELYKLKFRKRKVSLR